MASLTFSGTCRSLSLSSVIAADTGKYRCTYSMSNSKGISGGKRDETTKGLSTVTNIASPRLAPVIVPLPEKEKVGDRSCHVAWTSIRQERWEGELAVEGEIPLWLVHIYLFYLLAIN